jgi:branched-chain amino acid transport system permease protein
MAVAAVDWGIGSEQKIVQLPEWLRASASSSAAVPCRWAWAPTGCSSSRSASRWHSRCRRCCTHAIRQPLRAAVDDPRVAAGLGIPVDRVFLLTFAVGSGLAGLGGALGADILGVEPNFPLKFMVYFLIVCAVGGTSSITGPLVAALVLGMADVFGKYYVPKLGSFIVYVLMIAILLWRPQGLFTRQGAR